MSNEKALPPPGPPAAQPSTGEASPNDAAGGPLQGDARPRAQGAPAPAETRREYLARKQRERRAKLLAEGKPPAEIWNSGPSGPSGGKATQATRAKRYRDKKKHAEDEDKC